MNSLKNVEMSPVKWREVDYKEREREIEKERERESLII